MGNQGTRCFFVIALRWPIPLDYSGESEMGQQKYEGSRSTTGAGAPAPSDRHSLTVNPDGPILLHDVHFLEQMAHFNREKVPERQPHAKGAGAFGVFETTGDI